MVCFVKNIHPEDYARYGDKIELSLSNPDYVGQNSADNSIEYVKEFLLDQEYVKVAVRVSQNGRYFVRSLYCLNARRVKNFIAKGTLVSLKS